jgi:hypothetical protein
MMARAKLGHEQMLLMLARVKLHRELKLRTLASASIERVNYPCDSWKVKLRERKNTANASGKPESCRSFKVGPCVTHSGFAFAPVQV